MLDRRSLLKLSAAGAATLGTGIRVAHAQDKPRRGGTLTIGRNHDADTLYPGRSTGLSAIATNLLLYDGLVLHDFQMKIRPALAERWEVSPDGLTWTFHLRKNVKFHCSAPLTAQDVKDHFDRWIDPKEAFPTRAKVTSLAETRVVDEHTLVCKLKNPTLVFLNNVSQTEWGYASVPHAKHVAQYGQDYGVVPASICGTGPFKLKEWTKDDRQEIVQFVMKGQADVSHGFLHPLVPGATPKEQMRPFMTDFSLDKSKRLLSEAGWMPAADGMRQKDGKPLQASLYVFTELHERIVTPVQAQLRQVGFDLQIKRLESAAFTTATRAGEHDARFLPMIYSSADFLYFFVSAAIPSPNTVRWRDDKTDTLFHQSQVTLKETERVKAFQGIEQRLVGEAVVVPIQHIRWIFGSRPRAHGLKYHPIHGIYKLMDVWV